MKWVTWLGDASITAASTLELVTTAQDAHPNVVELEHGSMVTTVLARQSDVASTVLARLWQAQPSYRPSQYALWKVQNEDVGDGYWSGIPLKPDDHISQYLRAPGEGPFGQTRFRLVRSKPRNPRQFDRMRGKFCWRPCSRHVK